MNVRTIVVSLLALICGASAAMGVNQLNKRRGMKSVETTTVVVAAAELARGSVLSETVVKVRPWPKDMLPDGALNDLEAAIGRTIMTRVVPGEPILEAKLAELDAGRGLAAMVPQGMRAFTIRTANVASGVAGFILPGNRVDVLLTTTGSAAGAGSGGGTTTTLMQNMEILAVDQRLEAPDENKVDPNTLKSVTLLVTPDQAARLSLAMNRGILQLSLRRPEDNAEADALPATMADLRYYQERPLPPLVQSAPSKIGEVVSAVASAMSAAARVAKDTPSSSPPREAQIRTIRGVHRGTVRIVKNASDSQDSR